MTQDEKIQLALKVIEQQLYKCKDITGNWTICLNFKDDFVLNTTTITTE